MHNIRIRRQRLILFGMTLILALLATRIAYLKIVKGEEYENAAKAQQTEGYDTTIVANRGSIVDRNNQAFAVSTRVYDLEKKGMEAADKVIAVSDLTRNIVINKYGISPDKVVAVHNAVDFSGRENIEVERGVEDKVVTFLGRVTYQKGPEYFIEAAAKVLKRCPHVRFVMAGNGDMLNRCIRHVARLGISDKFHFTGFLRGKEVQKMFALSDVYVMPSISEPFGISPLEAMQTYVPSVISKQSGCAGGLLGCGRHV